MRPASAASFDAEVTTAVKSTPDENTVGAPYVRFSNRVARHITVKPEHLFHVRVSTRRSQHFKDANDHLPHASTMDVRIAAIEVTQCSRESMANTFEQDAAMPIAVQLGKGAGEAKLERHIEAWRSAHPAEIVHGHAALSDNLQEPRQSSLPGLGDLEHTARRPAKSDD